MEVYSWPFYTVPVEYIKNYLLLILGVFVAIPFLFSITYTTFGYIINFAWADWFFMKWLQKKELERLEKERLKRMDEFRGK